jgi:serine/threonine-protein kinase
MSDPVDRLNAALEDRYRIERKLGEGGMATVYLAEDLRHKRPVALKVLKPELAAVVGGERFLAEIETTANLQHPHILPLFDSGEADGFLFYVMPYVEGETLQERIEREKQLPVDEALGIATAVANALQTAHDAGVVHRDIKPANILLSRGEPLVADFGIALAVGAAGGSRLTETGLSVGTPFYMSPEQATGDQVLGPATDTYALACVLYEMLVGEPPYLGNTAQAVLGKIIQGTPVSATTVRRSVPANVDAAIRKSLERLPADRFTGAQEFAKALADPTFRHGEQPGVEVGGVAPTWKRAGVAGWALAAVFAGVSGWALLQPDPVVTPARFESPFRAGQQPLGPIELTPDGSALVYVGGGGGGSQLSQLWIRSWGDLDARPIPGTDQARPGLDGGQIGISPDGREVAFAIGSPGPLRVVPIAGGPSRTLVGSAFNASWSDDGWIYFSAGTGGISRVPANGGEVERLTELAAGEFAHIHAHPLPGGEAILFQVLRAGDGSDSETWSLDLASGERRVVTPGSRPRYTTSGHLLFGTADGRLMAGPFDPDRLEITGDALPVVEGVLTSALRGDVAWSVSANGTLAYWSGQPGGGGFEFVWVSRSGQAIPIDPGETFEGNSGNFGMRLSPDGSRLAFSQGQDNTDIWVKVMPDGPISRVTFGEGREMLPSWNPDGRSITFRSERTVEGDSLGVILGGLWTRPADGTGEAELLFDGFDAAKGVWSPDGEWLVIRRAGFDVASAEAARDILALRPGIDSVAVPLAATGAFWEQAPAISRDGRWLAYSSNETGRHEIFVRPFPDVDSGKWQVTSNGGVNPVWAHNGRELFFANPGSREMSVVEFTATTTTFGAGPATRLFTIPSGEFRFTGLGNDDFYDVALDDERFLMARAYREESGATSMVILVQNFFEELKVRLQD